MTEKKADWRRVNKSCPCPICGKDHWCAIDAADGGTVLCMRVREGGKAAPSGGWIHRLTESTKVRSVSLPKAKQSVIDAEFWMMEFWRELSPSDRNRWAERNGISPASARMFRVGYSPRHKAFTIPMYDATGKACGIRLRQDGGKKWAMKGSKQGCFRGVDQPRSYGWNTSETFIVEGPTDAMALHTAGFNVIGRPCCNGGGAIAKALIDAFEYPDRQVFIIADNDIPGLDGARALRRQFFPNAKIYTPPPAFKDVRDWVVGGADHGDIRSHLRSSEPVR